MKITSCLGLDWRSSLAVECLFYFRVCRNWRAVFKGRLHQIPFDRFELRTGQIIGFADTQPAWQLFEEIWRRQVYTKNYPRARPPYNIVDIGANIGVFSLYVMSRWPTARVFAYEPAPDNIKAIQRNLELSHAERVSLDPRAVAGSVGPVSFYLKEESGWHSLFADGAQTEVQVEAITLKDVADQVGNAQIDFLKIDCEGAEYAILEGREEMLSQRVRFVAMEYHEIEDRRVQDLVSIFNRANFEVHYVSDSRRHTGMLYAANRAVI